MKINKEKLLKKLGDLKSGGKSNIAKYLWSPKAGKYQVRLLEYPHWEEPPDDDICPELYFHYGIGKMNVLCLEKNFGKECPVCEAVSLLEEPARDDKEVWKTMMNASAKPQAFIPIVVRGEKDIDGNPVVKLWRINKTIHIELLEYLQDEDYEDMFDIHNGFDFVVIKEDKSASNPYGKTTIQPKRKSSPLSLDKNEIKYILENIPNVNEVYTENTIDEITDALRKWRDGDEPSNEDVDKLLGSDSSTGETSEIDSQLDDILNDDEDETDGDDILDGI